MKRLVTISLLAMAAFSVKSQENQFSQYFTASLFLNPGFAGVYSSPIASINHRRQPGTADFVNELTQFSFIFPLKVEGTAEKPMGGVGITLLNDKTGLNGVFQSNAAFLTYAHNVKFGTIDSEVLTLGIQAGYEIRSVAFSQLAWGSQYNPFLGFDELLPTPVTELDDQVGNLLVNAGIMYYYNSERDYLLYDYSAFSGISVTNLNQPQQSFITDSDFRSPMLIKYNGGFEIKLKKLFIQPGLFFQYLQNNYQFNGGITLSFAPASDNFRTAGPEFLVGSWYRFRDSFIFLAGAKIDRVAVRFSYDLNTKLFAEDRDFNLSQNSLEVSIQYILAPKDQGSRKSSNPLF